MEPVEYTLPPPHPDIELGMAREPRRARLAAPSAGMRPDTGLILYIHGYGSAFDEPYTLALLTHLADTYNCVALCVDYSGAELYKPATAMPAGGFFEKAASIYGLEPTQFGKWDRATATASLMTALANRGVKNIDSRCFFVRDLPSYQSFGLLQTLDHLQAVHQLLQQAPIDRRRLYVLGTSFGGYLAAMLLKFAPNTFRMVIDNSGFTSVDEDIRAIEGWTGTDICGVKAFAQNTLRWSLEPGKPRYFGPAQRALRNLRDASQLAPSDTRFFSFISTQDHYFAPGRKAEQIAAYATHGPATLREIAEADLDGALFKTLEHGMQASMRRLFAHCYEQLAPSEIATTDFELGTVREMFCGEQTYRLHYSMAHGIQASLQPSAHTARAGAR